MTTKYNKVGLFFMAFLSVFAAANMILSEPIQATGGAGEIKGLIDPMLDRAIEALQNNNTELALEEIQTVKNELEDTFSADENEDDEED